MSGKAKDLHENFVHLGLGAIVVPQPAYGGPEWYGDYGTRHGGDGAEGRLVAMHRFSGSWSNWEMHPAGAELVVCVSGSITLVQEQEGTERRTTLRPGEYAINPPGVWHTADVNEPTDVLFVTAGIGTEHRDR